MKRLCLSVALIIVTIGSLVAMQSNNSLYDLEEVENKRSAFHDELKKTVENKPTIRMARLLKQRGALEAFRDKLTDAVNQAALELAKYERDEATLYAPDMLISKFNTNLYTTDDMPATTVSLMKIYAEMMQSSYAAYANQYEDRENIVPIESRTLYTSQDYKNTYDMLVIPFINTELERVDAEIADLEVS